MKAKAESGMVASTAATPSQASDWLAAVTVAHTGANKEFLPTSTANGESWYHAVASDINSATAKAGSYETLTLHDDGTGCYAIRSGEEGSYTYSSPYYLYNEIKFQASAGTAITGQDIYVKDLVASAGESPTSEDLDKALRVGFKWGTADFVIYNALNSTTTSINVNGSNTATESRLASATANVNTSVIASSQTLAAYTDAGTYATTLKVYCWFEGEDANCKSTNLTATLDQITITFSIGIKDHPTA